MPLLLLFEAYQLVQRLRRRDEPAPTPVSSASHRRRPRPAPLDSAPRPSGPRSCERNATYARIARSSRIPGRLDGYRLSRWSPSASGGHDPGGCRPSSGRRCSSWPSSSPSHGRTHSRHRPSRYPTSSPWRRRRPARPPGHVDDRPGDPARRSDLAGAARADERSDARFGPGGGRARDARCCGGGRGGSGSSASDHASPRRHVGRLDGDRTGGGPGSGPGWPASPCPDLARHGSVHRRARDRRPPHDRRGHPAGDHPSQARTSGDGWSGWWTDGGRAASIDDSVTVVAMRDQSGIAAIERIDRTPWPIGRYEFQLRAGDRTFDLTVCLTRPRTEEPRGRPHRLRGTTVPHRAAGSR